MTVTLTRNETAVPPASPPTPFSVIPESSLVEDVAGWKDVLVNTYNPRRAGEPIARYELNGAWRAAIVINSEYQTLSRNAGAATWELTPGPRQAAGCLGVVAVQGSAARAWVLAVKEQSISVFEDGVSGPRYIFDIPGAYSHVQVSYTPAVPVRVPVISMADNSGNLVLYVADKADCRSWTRYQIDVKGALAEVYFRTVALSPGKVVIGAGWDRVFRISVDLTKGPSVSGPYYDRITNAYPVGGYQLDWDDARFVYVGLTTAGAVYVQRRDRTEQLPGNWAGAAATTDDQGFLHVYLTQDSTQQQRLSVLHQIGWAADGPVWNSAGNVPTAIPLTLWVERVQCDPLPRSNAGILALGYPNWVPEYMRTVRVLAQDPLTGTWTDEQVRTSSETYYRLPRWRIRALLADANGVPVGGHSVRIRSLSTGTVRVQGLPQTVGPRDDQAIDVHTDPAGAVSFSLDAASLTPSSILLDADGLAEEVELRPAKAIHDYFTGTTTLPGKPVLSGKVLRDAQVNGKPLIPSWPGDLQPDQAAELMRSALALADPNLPQPPAAAYVLQTADASAPAYQVFDSTDALEAERLRWQSAPEFGGFLDEVEDFFADVANAVSSGAASVGRMVLRVAERAVEIVLKIGDRLVNLGEFVIHTVRDAIRAVECVWRALGTAMEDILAWLRDQLISPDIWDTRTVLETNILQLPGFLQNQLEIASRYTDGFFGRQKAAVHAQIAALKREYVGQSLADQPQLAATARDYVEGHPAAPGEFDLAAELRRPSCLWMAEKVAEALGVDGALLQADEPVLGAAATAELQGAWDAFTAALESSGGNFIAALDDVGNLLRNLLADVSIPAMLQLQVTTLLNLADHLVDALLDLCDALLQALVALLRTALSGLESLLRAGVDLEPLESLNKFLARLVGKDPEPLTIAGLLSLVAAFPATLSWKALHGADAKLFPAGRVSGDLRPGPELGEYAKDLGWAHCGAAWGFIDGLVESVLDAVPTQSNTLNHRLIIASASFFRLATAMANWPNERGVPFTAIDWSDTASRVTAEAWGAGLVGPLIDFAPALLPNVGRLARNLEPVGQWALCGAGTATFLLGLAAAAVGNEPWPWKLSDIAEPLADVFAPLRSTPAEVATDGGGRAAKVAVDFAVLNIPSLIRGIYNWKH